jgi:hypothetical protein
MVTAQSSTNPEPCGICGETCGYMGPDGNGNYQCSNYGSLWSDDDATGIGFIARLLHVERATVDQWRRRPRTGFPPPSWPVEETGSPQWRRRTIIDWAQATGRL